MREPNGGSKVNGDLVCVRNICDDSGVGAVVRVPSNLLFGGIGDEGCVLEANTLIDFERHKNGD